MATRLFPPPHGSLLWFRERLASGESGRYSVRITPQIAIELLKLNTNNRHVKVHALEQYRRAMRLGFWRGHNGETIKFTKDGALADGQHRLSALRDVGAEIDMEVAFGLDNDDAATIDQGKARTAADIDRRGGGDHSEVSCAVSRKILAYEVSGRRMAGSTSRISNAEVNDRLWHDDRVRDSAVWATANRCPGLPASSVGFCHYVLSSVHIADTEDYLQKVCKGIGLDVKSPATTVRDYLINPTGAGRKTQGQKIEAVLRGWNAFRKNRSLAKIVTNGTYPDLI